MMRKCGNAAGETRPRCSGTSASSGKRPPRPTVSGIRPA